MTAEGTSADAIAVARRWFDAVNSADLELFRSIVAADYVHHSGAGDLTADEVVEGFWYYKNAFPDLRYDLDALLAVDGGAAVARWTMRGTHTGEDFFGAEPSGRTFASPGLSLHRIHYGRIVEEWEYDADLGQLRQLGFTLQKPGA